MFQRILILFIFTSILVGLLLGGSHLSVKWHQKAPALLTVTFRHANKSGNICRPATAEEKAKMLPHMRQDTICERKNAATLMNIMIDGQSKLEKIYEPMGFNKDGRSAALESFDLDAGPRRIQVLIKDDLQKQEWDYQFDQTIDIQKNKRYLVELRNDGQFRLYN